MGASKHYSVLLKTKAKRRLARRLLLFFEMLGLYVSAGYDLSYAWIEAVDSSEIFAQPNAHESMNDILRELENKFQLSNYRFTFSVLRQLYSRGASLGPALQSFSRTLRRDLEREIEGHLREAPIRANISLLLFFLPPALALVIIPLLEHLRALVFSP
ncbi:MAG: hypothetical protein ACKN9V_06025 [Pseudomonadota bacterium]